MLITPKQLYKYAEAHDLLDAPIRVCDGMAVSYFLTHQTLARSQSLVLDVSSCDPIEYDQLTPAEQRLTYAYPVE